MDGLNNTTMLALALAILGGYLLGSIPFGLIAAKLGGAGDVRKIGSGNIGATNVLRTGRKDLALITLLGDGGKGAVAVLLACLATDYIDTGALRGEVVAMAGAAAFIGHLFPVWLKFKGGKGVATFFGVLIAACWPAGLAAGAIWLIVAFTLRYSSLAALCAAALSPILLIWPFHGGMPFVYLAFFMAVLIFVRHRANISRLLKGEEPRIGKKG